MAIPLAFNSFNVSSKVKDSAAAKAVYSPSECPAKKVALCKSILNSFLISWNIEYPTIKIAGCVFSVKSNSSLGPSKIIFDIGKDNVLSASINIFLTISNF